MAKTGPSQLARAILETADGMRRTGIMDDAAHEKITLRHLGPLRAPPRRSAATRYARCVNRHI